MGGALLLPPASHGSLPQGLESGPPRVLVLIRCSCFPSFRFPTESSTLVFCRNETRTTSAFDLPLARPKRSPDPRIATAGARAPLQARLQPLLPSKLRQLPAEKADLSPLEILAVRAATSLCGLQPRCAGCNLAVLAATSLCWLQPRCAGCNLAARAVTSLRELPPDCVGGRLAVRALPRSVRAVRRVGDTELEKLRTYNCLRYKQSATRVPHGAAVK